MELALIGNSERPDCLLVRYRYDDEHSSYPGRETTASP
jgi:hypothetical protein